MEETQIYIISGKARHGKDTVANIISKLCHEEGLKFLNLQYSTYLKEYAKKISDWDGSEENKPRTLLQQLGTEVIRTQIDELFFVKKMIEDLKVYSRYFDVITISDARYKVEIDYIKKEFAKVTSVNVQRPNLKSNLTKEQQQHLTEIDLDDYNKHDLVIINDGDLKQLEAKVAKNIKIKTKITHNEMRELWFEFWRSKKHDIIPSASLVPVNDPTLLWINAGVAPLKKYFDGTLIPNNKRMANSQKCIRTNDIEVVGRTARHATFFEMLGNFSIGDYFKKEAIEWSWEFLTSDKWLGFEPTKLYITIYPNDEQAYDSWIKVGVKPSHIIRLKDNFWEIGPGPSGPCSEIFYDRGRKYDVDNIGINLLIEDQENDRYIEIWNNVFSMYNAEEGVSREDYKELPSKNIDTGMGLERMLVILQNVETIYDTDLFKPIIKEIENITKQSYKEKRAFKVIADHIRTLTFALADGANFGNNGRDYVLRRLLRRSVRYGKELKMVEPFVYKLVPVVIDIMKQAYAYLKNHKDQIMDKIKKEEQLFHQTLILGENKLQELMNQSSNKIISGNDAFKLYDTYGFPFELTLEIAEEQGYKIDKKEFEDSMKQQQEQARQARNNVSSMAIQNEALINYKEISEFAGHDKVNVKTIIIGLFNGFEMVKELKEEGYIVLEQTPFYAEAGGQVSDEGYLLINNQKLKVLSVFKGPNQQHFHLVEPQQLLEIGNCVEANVDLEIRQSIVKNHSAAHLLQKALKEVLGEEVLQAGSKIGIKTLRFDFTYDNKIDDEELLKTEKIVNQKIKKNLTTKTEVMSLDAAIEKGATALFAEKYGKEVRVVTIVDSVELCGGIHVKNTKEIESFAIMSIDNKGNNVYRIEAATSNNIESSLIEAIKPYVDNLNKLLNKADKIINDAQENNLDLSFEIKLDNNKLLNYENVIQKRDEISQVQKLVHQLEVKYNELMLKKSLSDLTCFEEQLTEINGIQAIITSVNNYDLVILKEIISVLSNKYKNSFIFIANINNGNVNFMARATKSLETKINCGEIVKTIATKANGSGGGSRLYAQGGASSIDNLDNLIEEVKLLL